MKEFGTMTLREFERLPWLLKAGQVCVVLGCDREVLRTLRLEHPGFAVRIKGMKQWRYRKVVLARVIGLG